MNSAISNSLDAETRFVPFSYFWTCWKLTPTARARAV